MRQVPAWPMRCGNLARGMGADPQRHHQGAGEPTKGVQGYIHSKTLKGKICGRKKLPLRSKHYIITYQKSCFKLFSLGKLLQILTYHRGAGRAMVSADGGLVFFQQRQEGSKGLIPGYKLTQVQTCPGGREGIGSKTQGCRPFSTGLWFFIWVNFSHLL